MKLTTSIEEFAHFVGFWGGAEEVWEKLTEDEKDRIEEMLENGAFEFEGIEQVNAFMKIDVPEIFWEYDEEDEIE